MVYKYGIPTYIRYSCQNTRFHFRCKPCLNVVSFVLNWFLILLLLLLMLLLLWLLLSLIFQILISDSRPQPSALSIMQFSSVRFSKYSCYSQKASFVQQFHWEINDNFLYRCFYSLSHQAHQGCNSQFSSVFLCWCLCNSNGNKTLPFARSIQLN